MERVDISEFAAKFIAERIRNFETEADEKSAWLAPYVEKTQILPLFNSLAESFGIDSNGNIKRFATEWVNESTDAAMSPETVEQYYATLISGVRKYPELNELLPSRPVDATTCSDCNGSGWKSTTLICTCGGVGWRETA